MSRRSARYGQCMGRPHRCQEPGYYHVTQRGVAREIVYLDDADRELFLWLLTRTVRRYAWTLHAYCLMSNHVHLVVQLREPTLASGMQYLTGIYGRRFNERHDRRGGPFPYTQTWGGGAPAPGGRRAWG